MRNRIIFITIGVLIATLIGATAFLAHKTATADKIAQGITIGEIPVGSLNTEGAHSELDRRVLKELGDPITVHYEDKHYTLTTKEAKVGVDIEGAIQTALHKTRSGNLIERAWRQIAKKDVAVDIPLQVTYSDQAVDKFLGNIKDELRRKPVDASLHFTTTRIQTRPDSTGLEVLTQPVRKRIIGALKEPGRKRDFRLPTRVLEPKVRESELAQRNPVAVTIDRTSFRLTIFKHLKKHKSYPIAVGKEGNETPTGLYNIYNKKVDPDWNVPDEEWAGEKAGKRIPGGDPENALKARWLGILGEVGIHGTDAEASLGSAASHGCIRMSVKDVKEVYDKVPINAPVFIH